MIKFDSKGLLVPNTSIICTVEELKSNFVDSIRSKTRLEIFNNYISYSNELKEMLDLSQLKQFINGSFVTKISNPKDIDFVSFIDYEHVEKFEVELKKYVSNDRWLASGLDPYLVKVYPESHKLYPVYQLDLAYWIDKFDKTRRNNRTGIKSVKGFLEIKF